jgi:hypothetical protein
MGLTSHPIPNRPVPTLDRLGASVPQDLDAKKVAMEWFDTFSAAIVSSNIQAFSSLFIQDAFWRDILALTWDFRTFFGFLAIEKFLSDRLGSTKPTDFKLHDDKFLRLEQPFPDVVWIIFMFDFKTDTGIASGVARLVPTASGAWKAYSVFTNLEDLKDFPEKLGPLRNPHMNHGNWEEARRREREFIDADGKQKEPAVVIIGAGYSGLNLAARLKYLDVPTLVVEKDARVGDVWRNRSKTLTLHNPVREHHLIFFLRYWLTIDLDKIICIWHTFRKSVSSLASHVELNYRQFSVYLACVHAKSKGTSPVLSCCCF